MTDHTTQDTTVTDQQVPATVIDTTQPEAVQADVVEQTPVKATIAEDVAPVADVQPIVVPVEEVAPVEVVTEPTPAEPVPNIAAVEVVAAPVAVDTTTNVQVSEFDAMIAGLKITGSVAQQQVISILEAYVDNMKPSMPQNPSTIAVNQTKLWNLISNAIEVNDGSFKARWNLILAYYKQYANAALGAMYVNRLSANMNLSPAKLITFQNINHLAMVTADPAARDSGVKQTDFKRMMVGLNSTATSNIIGFYRVQ